VEGMSLRATARAAEVSYNTICKLAAEAGAFVPNIRTSHFVIFHASAYSSMKSGVSFTRKKT